MSSPVTLSTSTADGVIIENNPTTNYGTDIAILVSPLSANRRRALLKFDFSALVPAGATITVATLKLYNRSTRTAGRTISVYRLLRTDWVETQATWNIYKTGSSWGTVGALNATTDYTATDAATATSLSADGWVSWNVKNQIQTALDSVSGVTHFLIADDGATATAVNTFNSREYTAIANRWPILYIEYTVPSAVSPNFLPFFWA